MTVLDALPLLVGASFLFAALLFLHGHRTMGRSNRRDLADRHEVRAAANEALARRNSRPLVDIDVEPYKPKAKP